MRLIEPKVYVRNKLTDGFTVFRLYCAVKAHFQGTFDVSKYGLRVNVTRNSFDKRKDKVFFERIAQKLDAQRCYELFMYNLAANPSCLAYELSGSDAYEFYIMYSGRLDMMSALFTEALGFIFDLLIKTGKEFSDLFKGDGHPVIFQLLMQGSISLESFIILDELLHFMSDINNKYQEDLLWISWYTKINQYRKLISIDLKKAKQMFVEAKNEYIINKNS